jgi:hypothetical protein
VYHHKALSIQTIQAFSKACNDVQTKDAVTIEAARAVYGGIETGYIESGSTDGDLKIVEIARNLVPNGK